MRKQIIISGRAQAAECGPDVDRRQAMKTRAVANRSDQPIASAAGASGRSVEVSARSPGQRHAQIRCTALPEASGGMTTDGFLVEELVKHRGTAAADWGRT